MSGRPNVVLLLAEDLGFAHLGITGSEIQTPNIDALAQGGMLLTSTYNCARCCPTGALLLTGRYPRSASVGHMGPILAPRSIKLSAQRQCHHMRPSAYAHKGGISTPLVAHWPDGFGPQPTAYAACHVVNILPTILEVTGASYLSELRGGLNWSANTHRIGNCTIWTWTAQN